MASQRRAPDVSDVDDFRIIGDFICGLQDMVRQLWLFFIF